MNNWRHAIIAPDGTHHLLEGRPMYARRFAKVSKYHEPGLAPSVDDGGACHIDARGEVAYAHRFKQTFGFYEGVAAVEDRSGWFHIGPSGSPLYPERYAWCGNMQGGRVAVRTREGLYLHLTRQGRPAYRERHLYAGDYRDGVACVRRSNGLVSHVDENGADVHPGRFADLDVYHKGFARARDPHGWLHIDQKGSPAYALRLAAVEPFYNGQALCETHDGRRVILDESGTIIHTVWTPSSAEAQADRRVVLVVGSIGSGKSTVAGAVASQFDWPHLAIDEYRRHAGDGTAAGELAAWSSFVRAIQEQPSSVVEFSGSGPFTFLVKNALARLKPAHLVLWIRASAEACWDRCGHRPPPVPYPDFGVPFKKVVFGLTERLEQEMADQTHWKHPDVKVLDGSAPAGEVIRHAVRCCAEWLKREPAGTP